MHGTDEVLVGIDVGKTWLDVAWLRPNAAPTTARIANTEAGIGDVVASVAHTPPTLIALEATGAYHRPLLAALLTAHQPVALINPAQLKAFRQARLGRQKTDRADAVLLARFAQVHGAELPRATPTSEQQAHLRALVTYREGLVADQTRLRNRQHAAEWSGDEAVPGWLADDLTQLAARLADVERAMAEVLRAIPEAAVVQTVPGVGPRVAATVLALLPQSLWGNAKAAAAYAGVHPRQTQSGDRAPSHLSKQGSPVLRRVLYMAAVVAIQHDATMRAVYDRQVATGTSPQSARCIVMHKILRPMMGERRAAAARHAPPDPLAA
jgi:transposase